MYLSQLFLNNFRNYSEEYVQFNPNLNLIIGDNAQGKTNLLEAIYLLGTGNSHRTNINSELVNWEQNGFYLKGELIKETQDYKLEIKMKGRSKEIRVNNNQLDKNSDLLGYLNVIIFSPEDLELVKGSPSRRRKFINLELSQIQPYYKHSLKEYDQVVKQRNQLLKKIRDRNAPQNMLDVWDQQLVDLGTKVIVKRLAALEKLKVLARLMQRKLTNGAESLKLSYDSKLNISDNSSAEEIKDKFSSYVKQKRDKEIERGVTTVGPHRDDISLIVNDVDVRKYGSQGQQRTTALALKLSELEFMKSEIGEYPVLLLDDVFSELDDKRSNYLFNTIKNKIQTFITNTNLKRLKDLEQEHSIYRIKAGSVIGVN
ncbi:MAG: DNA replication/repair protein RecF [Halanaerobacter sp.]